MWKKLNAWRLNPPPKVCVYEILSSIVDRVVAISDTQPQDSSLVPPPIVSPSKFDVDIVRKALEQLEPNDFLDYESYRNLTWSVTACIGCPEDAAYEIDEFYRRSNNHIADWTGETYSLCAQFKPGLMDESYFLAQVDKVNPFLHRFMIKKETPESDAARTIDFSRKFQRLKYHSQIGELQSRQFPSRLEECIALIQSCARIITNSGSPEIHIQDIKTCAYGAPLLLPNGKPIQKRCLKFRQISFGRDRDSFQFSVPIFRTESAEKLLQSMPGVTVRWQSDVESLNLQQLYYFLRSNNLRKASALDFMPWKYCTHAKDRETHTNQYGVQSTFKGWTPEFLSTRELTMCLATDRYKQITADCHGNHGTLTFETLGDAFKETFFYRTLLEIVCDDSQELCNFLLAWIADIEQRPWRRSCIVPFVSGEQGSGKNSITNYLKQILGYHNVTEINTSRRLFQQFNAFLGSGSLLNVVNEMKARGKAYEKCSDQMKSLVADESLQIEPKGKEIREVRNLSRYWLISNWAHCLNAERSNRRYLFLKCSPKYIGKRSEFFAPLNAEMRDLAVVLAIADCLNRIDLSKVDCDALPSTKFELAQKISQQGPIFEFIVVILKSLPDNPDEIGKYSDLCNYRVLDGTLYMRPRGVYQAFCYWHRTEFSTRDTNYDLRFFMEVLNSMGFKKTRPQKVFPDSRPYVIEFKAEHLQRLATFLQTSVQNLQEALR